MRSGVPPLSCRGDEMVCPDLLKVAFYFSVARAKAIDHQSPDSGNPGIAGFLARCWELAYRS